MQIQSIAATMGQKGGIRPGSMSRDLQGLKTNQGPSAAKTLMTRSLNKEASQLLCDAMQCRLKDGDAAAEDWPDSNGDSLRPDRIWKSGIEDHIAADDAGPCMGIELNIWERAKVSNVYLIIALIGVMNIIHIVYFLS